MLEAVTRLDHDFRSSLDVIFVGDGKLGIELRSRVQQLGLNDTIQFAGRRPPDEVPSWMAAADLLCLPSRREGCPNVVLEALACGRPVVASNVGGVPELLSEQNGIVVPPDNPDRLAAGMQ